MSVFGIHDPIGLRCRLQIEVAHSKLNFHKFKHNFRDTVNPMCPTNDGTEEHFMLQCPSFDIPRREFSLQFRNRYGHSSKSRPFQTKLLFSILCMAINNFQMTKIGYTPTYSKFHP